MLNLKALACFTALSLLNAAEVSPARGKLIFEDDFNGGALKTTWKTAKGKWIIAEGKLKGVELPADKHAAVVRHPVKYHDAIIELKFKLDGAKMTSLSLNQQGGHNSRVILRPDGLTVQKDRMNAKSDDKAAVLAKLDHPIEPGKWHTLLVQLRGKRISAKLDGSAWVGGEHSAIDTDRADVGLPVAGDSASFDSIRVWELGR